MVLQGGRVITFNYGMFFKNSRLEERKLYLTIPPLLMGGDVQLSVRNEKYEYYSNKIKCCCEKGSI